MQETVVLVLGQGVQEDEYYLYCFAKELTFWQTFIFLLWPFFICCHKVYEF